jgi:hypothetical protein
MQTRVEAAFEKTPVAGGTTPRTATARGWRFPSGSLRGVYLAGNHASRSHASHCTRQQPECADYPDCAPNGSLSSPANQTAGIARFSGGAPARDCIQLFSGDPGSDLFVSESQRCVRDRTLAALPGRTGLPRKMALAERRKPPGPRLTESRSRGNRGGIGVGLE